MKSGSIQIKQFRRDCFKMYATDLRATSGAERANRSARSARAPFSSARARPARPARLARPARQMARLVANPAKNHSKNK